MATPEVQLPQSVDDTLAPVVGAAFAPTAARLPRWWVLPLIGVVMLAALLLFWLGARYELAAVAWAGIALFGMTVIATVIAGVHYGRMLLLAIRDWWRSTGQSQ